jgi:hypothetical protein
LYKADKKKVPLELGKLAKKLSSQNENALLDDILGRVATLNSSEHIYYPT